MVMSCPLVSVLDHVECGTMAPVKKPKRTRLRTCLKEWREYRGLTQEQVAEFAQMSRENYGKIEGGKLPYSQDLLELCAPRLGCAIADLISAPPPIDTSRLELMNLYESADPEGRETLIRVAKTLLKSR